MPVSPAVPTPAPPVPVMSAVSVPRPTPTPPPPMSVPAPVSVPMPPVPSVPISTAAAAPPPVPLLVSLPPSLLHIPPAKPSQASSPTAVLLLLGATADAAGDLEDLGLPLQSPPHLHGLLQLRQVLPDLDEAEVKFPPEMVRQPPVVIVDPEVGRANLADSQLLLLVGAGRHGVPVLLLRLHLPLPQVLHLLHQLDALLHVAVSAELLGRGQLLTDILCQLVDRVGFVCDLLAQSILGLCQGLLGLLNLLVAVADEGYQVVAGVHVVEVIFVRLSGQVVGPEGDVVHPGALPHVHPGGGEDVVGAAVQQEGLADDLVVVPGRGGLSCKGKYVRHCSALDFIVDGLKLADMS